MRMMHDRSTAHFMISVHRPFSYVLPPCKTVLRLLRAAPHRTRTGRAGPAQFMTPRTHATAPQAGPVQLSAPMHYEGRVACPRPAPPPSPRHTHTTHTTTKTTTKPWRTMGNSSKIRSQRERGEDDGILAEGAMTLPVTLSGGVLFAS